MWTQRVLLIDDDGPLLRVYGRLFNMMGYQVTSFTSAPAALSYLQEFGLVPHIVMVAYQMPEMDGLRFLREFRGFNRQTPVMIYTARAEDVSRKEAARYGAEVVCKPLCFEEMRERVGRMIERSMQAVANQGR